MGLSFFEPKDFLPQNKAGKHPEETSRGKLRIHLAERAIPDPLLNVVCDGVPRGHTRDEHVRKLVAFQGTE